MRDAGEVKDRIIVVERIEARMIAERPFAAQFAQFDVAFEHDLGLCGHLDVDGFALHHLDRLRAKEAGDHHLIEIGRQGQNRRVHRRRIRADRDRDLHALGGPCGTQAAIMFRSLFMSLPVHAGGTCIVHL